MLQSVMMKSSFFLLLLAGLGGWAQTTPPDAAKPADQISPSAVVVIEGHKYTAEELQKVLSVLNPQAQQAFAKDRKEFVRRLGVQMHLSHLAEESKLDEQSPVKEQLELNRMSVLANAEISDKHKHILVSEEDRTKYFEAHKDRYTQAKVKLIYVAFSPNAATAAPDAKGKKPLTEEQAKARAEEVLKKARAEGGDFVALVKEYSDDPISVSENGDFGPIKSSDNIDNNIKAAVFALKPGDISEPIRQPNGFYIFRLEEMLTQPFDQVKDQIYNQIQNEKLQQWLTDADKNLDIKFLDESYFAAPATPPAPAPAPAAPSLKGPVK
jgi:parvulin-like peptidyl-prolyl isomerase